MRINQKTKDRWSADTARIYSALSRSSELTNSAHTAMLEFGDPLADVLEAECQAKLALDAIRDIKRTCKRNQNMEETDLAEAYRIHDILDP